MSFFGWRATKYVYPSRLYLFILSLLGRGGAAGAAF